MAGDPRYLPSRQDELLTMGEMLLIVLMLLQFTLFGPPSVALAVAGLLLSTVGIVKLRSQWKQVKTLQSRVETTEGTVTAADYRTTWGQPYGKHNCEPEIAVEYSYDGEQYTTKTVYPGDWRVWFRPDDMQRFLDDYEEGATTTVYVDPSRPRRAYLEPHREFEWWGRETNVPVFVVGIVVGLLGLLSSVPTP